MLVGFLLMFPSSSADGFLTGWLQQHNCCELGGTMLVSFAEDTVSQRSGPHSSFCNLSASSSEILPVIGHRRGGVNINVPFRDEHSVTFSQRVDQL